MIKIWTDGACSGNPGAGGWAAILTYKKTSKELSGYKLSTTNNEMEFYAILCALATLSPATRCNPMPIVVYTDSQYAINAITIWYKRWKKNNGIKSDGQPVVHWELIEKIHAEMKDRNVSFEWIRGHGKDIMNIRADKLAVEKRKLAKQFVKESRKNA